MSLLEQQNLLARLYVDENLRRAFLSDPSAVAAPFGLSDVEIDEISGILPGEIDYFAGSLRRKRMREVEKMLPLTRSALRDGFESFFIEYADATPSSQEIARTEDALEFCRYLDRKSVGDARDAARFELAKIEFYSGKRSFVVRRFDHEVREGRLVPGATFCVWARIGKRAYFRSYRLPLRQGSK